MFHYNPCNYYLLFESEIMNIASAPGNIKVALSAVIIGIAMTFTGPIAKMLQFYNSYQAIEYL